MKSIVATICLVLALASVAHAQKVIRLYPGPAPGSENWTQQEKESVPPILKTRVVTNVTEPTLTAYLPEKEAANGTAVVIAPGGGFHFLSIDSEGVEVAKWLSARGVAAFVLRYRLVRTGDDLVKEFMGKMADWKRFEADTVPVIPLAVADGLAAVTYVRKHAAEFGVSPERVGMMGFSAGGTVTTGVATKYSADSRPAFAAPIYAWTGPVQADVPTDAPPLFLVAATDDSLGLASDSVKLYGQWVAAKKPAELHIYSKGGHGFGMNKQNLPSDQWIERFGDWLAMQGLMKPLR